MSFVGVGGSAMNRENGKARGNAHPVDTFTLQLNIPERKFELTPWPIVKTRWNAIYKHSFNPPLISTTGIAGGSVSALEGTGSPPETAEGVLILSGLYDACLPTKSDAPSIVHDAVTGSERFQEKLKSGQTDPTGITLDSFKLEIPVWSMFGVWRVHVPLSERTGTIGLGDLTNTNQVPFDLLVENLKARFSRQGFSQLYGLYEEGGTVHLPDGISAGSGQRVADLRFTCGVGWLINEHLHVIGQSEVTDLAIGVSAERTLANKIRRQLGKEEYHGSG